jgi:hypothetical protein
MTKPIAPRVNPQDVSPVVLSHIKQLFDSGRTWHEIAAAFPNLFRGRRPNQQVRTICHRAGWKRPGNWIGRVRTTKHGNERRRQQARELAERYGLPGDLVPQQVKLLLALVDGPLCRRDLLQVIGLADAGVIRRRHSDQQGTHISNLIERGLVVYFRGRGCLYRTPGIYMLSGLAMEMMSKPQPQTEVA